MWARPWIVHEKGALGRAASVPCAMGWPFHQCVCWTSIPQPRGWGPFTKWAPLKWNSIIDQSWAALYVKKGQLVSPHATWTLWHRHPPPLIKNGLDCIPGPAFKINDKLAIKYQHGPGPCNTTWLLELCLLAVWAAGLAGWYLTHRQGCSRRSVRHSHFKVAALLARFTPEPISLEIRRGLEMELRPHFWAGENHLIPGKVIGREQWWIKRRKEREARGGHGAPHQEQKIKKPCVGPSAGAWPPLRVFVRLLLATKGLIEMKQSAVCLLAHQICCKICWFVLLLNYWTAWLPEIRQACDGGHMGWLYKSDITLLRFCLHLLLFKKVENRRLKNGDCRCSVQPPKLPSQTVQKLQNVPKPLRRTRNVAILDLLSQRCGTPSPSSSYMETPSV